MPVDNAHTETVFLYAFRDNLPMVLKIPGHKSKSKAECELFDQIGREAMDQNLALVPVQLLELKGGSVLKKEHSQEKIFGAGILMPHYTCTFATYPIPISIKFAKAVFLQLSPAINFIHSKQWMHGDIKPSNIFITAEGSAKLGDYGSSVTFCKIMSNFCGGTLQYQCEGYQTLLDPVLFDKFGLIISILEKLGLINASQRSVSVPLDAIKGALEDQKLSEAGLNEVFKEWLGLKM